MVEREGGEREGDGERGERGGRTLPISLAVSVSRRREVCILPLNVQ